MAEIRIGTSSFTAKGWDGIFYPLGLRAADRLSFYATKFDAVELDTTLYGIPAVSTVKGWYEKHHRASGSPPKFRSYVAMKIMWQNDQKTVFPNCFGLRGPHNLTGPHG